MRRSTLILLAGVAAAASACAPTRPDAPTTIASAPAPVDGYDWFFTDEGDSARLAYGVEASDDLKLGLTCDRGAGTVELSATAPDGADAEIHLESGGDTERFRAEVEDSAVSDGLFLTAQARADTPVLQRFRRLGWIAVWQGDRRTPLAAHPGSEARVGRFFDHCG